VKKWKVQHRHTTDTLFQVKTSRYAFEIFNIGLQISKAATWQFKVQTTLTFKPKDILTKKWEHYHRHH